MRIVRYKKDEDIFYGVLQENEIKNIEGDLFGEFSIGKGAVQANDVKLLSPIVPPNIIAIGLNYKKHAEEANLGFPDKPVIFLKATTSVIGPEEYIILPDMAPDEVDYETELVIVVGKKAKNIEREDVDNYILGYTCGNDVSARDCQLRLDQQWSRGKSFDTFCPLGPWIETELSNPDHQRIWTKLNGQIMQDSNTSDLIFDTKEIFSYCSKNFTLLPGTVIMTGTPGGVGFARKPPIFLKHGDIVEVGVEGIGALSNIVD